MIMIYNVTTIISSPPMMWIDEWMWIGGGGE